MPHRQSSQWVEAWAEAHVITTVWLWVIGFIATFLAGLAFIYYLIPIVFFWLLFGG